MSHNKITVSGNRPWGVAGALRQDVSTACDCQKRLLSQTKEMIKILVPYSYSRCRM